MTTSAYNTSLPFGQRIRNLFGTWTKSESTIVRDLEAFTAYELATDHSTYSPNDIRYLFTGDATTKGLFQLAGDSYLIKRGTPKPHARAALMSLFRLMANEQNPYMTNVFRQMPVSDLRKIALWKHMRHGDPEQQMAAFRLSRVLYHSYPLDQFRLVLNNKQRSLDLFNRLHATWLREHPATGAAAPAAPVALAAAPVAAAGLARGLTEPAIAAERLEGLPAAPTVEAVLQPVVQPIHQEVRQKVVQPVLQTAEVVQVEKAPIFNAPIERATIAETIINKPVDAASGIVPESALPARPIAEAAIQPIVKPVVEQVQETVIQPVVIQPNIVQVERAPIINAPIDKGFIQAPDVMAAPIDASELPAGMLPPRPIVESTLQPVFQEVRQQVHQKVIQPVFVSPEVVQVTKPAIVEAVAQAPTIVREAVIAPPIVMTGVQGVATGMQNLMMEDRGLPGGGAQTLAADAPPLPFGQTLATDQTLGTTGFGKSTPIVGATVADKELAGTARRGA